MKSTAMTGNFSDAKHALKRHWPRVRRVLQVSFVLLILGLVAHEAQKVEWEKVWSSMSNYKFTDLGLVMLLAVGSYAMFVNYDRLAKQYTGHEVSYGNTLLVSFICYTFNFNLGSLIGTSSMESSARSKRRR